MYHLWKSCHTVLITDIVCACPRNPPSHLVTTSLLPRPHTEAPSQQVGRRNSSESKLVKSKFWLRSNLHQAPGQPRDVQDRLWLRKSRQDRGSRRRDKLSVMAKPKAPESEAGGFEDFPFSGTSTPLQWEPVTKQHFLENPVWLPAPREYRKATRKIALNAPLQGKLAPGAWPYGAHGEPWCPRGGLVCWLMKPPGPPKSFHGAFFSWAKLCLLLLDLSVSSVQQPQMPLRFSICPRRQAALREAISVSQQSEQSTKGKGLARISPLVRPCHSQARNGEGGPDALKR